MTGNAPKLSAEAQDRALKFIQTQARPLEQHRYAYHFEHGSAADVLAELARFQNPDGGFGNALEPDLRLKDSSVIATTIAFQRFREVHAPADHPIVDKACQYLKATFMPDTLNWPIMPLNVDDAPHAPWWEYGGDLSHSRSNPRAEIAGYLFDYSDHFDESIQQAVIASVLAHLLEQPDHLEMHDLLCYRRLYETATLPTAIKNSLQAKLRHIALNTVARDPAQWREYGLPPLSIVTDPSSAFAPLFEMELPANLGFVIDRQTPAGCWSPNWSWDFIDAAAWAQAARDWQGVLTVDNLITLKLFGALE